ncbi:hypothetical protein [Variovorax sp. HJSM1_2]|uniref:hypothetical protein n=1 Tax=Variovorax sp. HJSM1_2 TaxID=3366263 RepID=UPI003BE60385
MPKTTFQFPAWVRTATLAASASLAAFLAGCTGGPGPSPSAPVSPVTPAAPSSPTAPSGTTTPGQPLPPPAPSVATTPRDYRKDAARHLYAHNADRIFKGKLPAHLYAIGVLDISVDARGQVTRLQWSRAPSHAPEVVKEIERTARAAAPYPVPARLGRVIYTDVWLWDKSGQFQLDTLTEGQL